MRDMKDHNFMGLYEIQLATLDNEKAKQENIFWWKSLKKEGIFVSSDYSNLNLIVS